ncbi:hypothetical protein GY45DRAFT_613968 [Cubamyces sp. BRFM 1775]|nr:hypothetical protein GY45DRAFT_613968 [Cubamyces sp. BRFM 1775]
MTVPVLISIPLLPSSLNAEVGPLQTNVQLLSTSSTYGDSISSTSSRPHWPHVQAGSGRYAYNRYSTSRKAHRCLASRIRVDQGIEAAQAGELRAP